LHLGRLAFAKQHCLSALEGLNQTFGTNSLPVASTLGVLGNISLRELEYKSAWEQFSAALEIRRQILGFEHPTTATMAFNSAVCLE
jgi:hypothetical protein